MAPGVVQVPVEALIAAGAVFLRTLEAAARGDLRGDWPDDLLIATVTAAAPVIVAAELRRQADAFQRLAAANDPRGVVFDSAASVLRRRADQLDPHSGGEHQ